MLFLDPVFTPRVSTRGAWAGFEERPVALPCLTPRPRGSHRKVRPPKLLRRRFGLRDGHNGLTCQKGLAGMTKSPRRCSGTRRCGAKNRRKDYSSTVRGSARQVVRLRHLESVEAFQRFMDEKLDPAVREVMGPATTAGGGSAVRPGRRARHPELNDLRVSHSEATLTCLHVGSGYETCVARSCNARRGNFRHLRSPQISSESSAQKFFPEQRSSSGTERAADLWNDRRKRGVVVATPRHPARTTKNAIAT